MNGSNAWGSAVLIFAIACSSGTSGTNGVGSGASGGVAGKPAGGASNASGATGTILNGGTNAAGGANAAGATSAGSGGANAEGGGANAAGSGGANAEGGGGANAAGAGGGASLAGASSFTASYIIGADISQVQTDPPGTLYTDTDGKQKDFLQIMKTHGFNYVRVRTFVDPRAADGNSKNSGYYDIAHTVAFGKRIKDAGFGLLLDFHFSDNWSDWRPLNDHGAATARGRPGSIHMRRHFAGRASE